MGDAKPEVASVVSGTLAECVGQPTHTGKVRIRLDPTMGGTRQQAVATGRAKGSGRRRIPMAKIAGLQARRVCFSKRRQGFFRKCAELCQLFPGYQIAVVAFSPDVGTPFRFNAPSSSSSPIDLFHILLSDVSSVSSSSSSTTAAAAPATTTTTSTTTTTTSLNNQLLQSPRDEEERAELEAALQWTDDTLESLLDEEERAELEAALQWADGILEETAARLAPVEEIRTDSIAVSEGCSSLFLRLAIKGTPSSFIFLFLGKLWM